MPFMGYASPRSPRSPGSGGLPGGVTEVTVLIHRARGERVGLRIFSPDERPVTVVRGVARGGPADRAGLQVGDQVRTMLDVSLCVYVVYPTHTHTHTHTHTLSHLHTLTHSLSLNCHLTSVHTLLFFVDTAAPGSW